MKNSLLLTAAFLIFVFSAQAQITLTNTAFADVGDVLKTRTATSAGTVTTITASGPNQTWDFSSVSGGNLDSYTIIDASAGTAAVLFPDADIILPNGILPGENYIKKTANAAEILGFSGDPLNIGVVLPVRLNDPRTVLQTPLNYQDVYTDYSNFQADIKVSDFPALKALVDSLVPPSTGILVDSLRIVYNDSTINEVDAWGTMKIPASDLPNDTYNVLRLKQTINSNIEIYFKGSFATIPFDWTNPANPPVSLSLPFAGPSSSLTYQFLNDTEKEPIIVATIGDPINNPGVITGVIYKSETNTSTNTFGFASPREPSVKAYPNPVIDNLNLKVKNFAPDNYDIKVYNIIGRELLSETHYIANDQTISVNLSSLKRGTYIYRITNERGETILTKRIMVIRP